MKTSEIKKLLPVIMQRAIDDSFENINREGSQEPVLYTFIKIMEEIHQPIEALLEDLDRVFDPRKTPEKFLPMLSHWMNLISLFKPEKAGAKLSLWQDKTLPTEPGLLRELIARSVELSHWRGTRYGLQQVLQTATGIMGFIVEDGPEPFHMRVGVPAAAQKYWELVERIVAQEKPAHVTSEIFLRATHIKQDENGKSSDDAKEKTQSKNNKKTKPGG